MPSVLAPYDTATGYLSTRSGVKSIGLAAGLTGATASSRYVGGTSSGAPVTGTFAVGDWIIDQTGKIFVATVAGSPGTWVQVGAGGGASITQVTFAESTVAPNATVYVDSITAAGASTNVDLALSSKGAGALTAHVADGTATGGNKRGASAVDWQTAARTVATQVASGSQSTLSGGRGNIASGTNSTVGGGLSNTASNTNSVVGGGEGNTASSQSSAVAGGNANTAGAQYTFVGGGQSNSNTGSGYGVIAGGTNNNISGGGYSFVGSGLGNVVTQIYGTVAGGLYGNSELYGKFAYANGRFAATGDAQFGLTVCRATTTTNAAINLTNDGSGTFSATNHIVLPNNRVYRFTLDLVASSGTIGTASTSTYGSFGGVWTITGAIRRAATAATTAIIGIPTVLATAVDSQLAAVTFTVLAETVTYGSLQIVATGLASTQIHWVATIMTTEVG